MTSSATIGSLGLGVDAGLAPPVARELAARCADLGYGSLWSNDEPGASGLETLAHFAAGAPQVDLGVGVLPLDQHPPAQIATEIDRLQLDPAKLWIGIGSGRLRPQLAPMRDAVAELRDLLPAARIMIGAMRCAAQLDVASTFRASARLGTRGSRRSRARWADHRLVRPRRGGRRRGTTAA